MSLRKSLTSFSNPSHYIPGIISLVNCIPQQKRTTRSSLAKMKNSTGYLALYLCPLLYVLWSHYLLFRYRWIQTSWRSSTTTQIRPTCWRSNFQSNNQPSQQLGMQGQCVWDVLRHHILQYWSPNSRLCGDSTRIGFTLAMACLSPSYWRSNSWRGLECF